MTDYIDRGSFLQLLDAYFSIPHCNLDYEAGVQKVKKMLEVYPPADVEPVRHAKNLCDIRGGLVECSACGAICNDTYTWSCEINYCPNCGAKMDEEVDKV